MTTDTIEISKCCNADTEEVSDAIGDFVLHACKKCGQECKLISVCEMCEGTGEYRELRAVDDIITVKCLCQIEEHDGDED